jgi:hypothetical protein
MRAAIRNLEQVADFLREQHGLLTRTSQAAKRREILRACECAMALLQAHIVRAR